MIRTLFVAVFALFLSLSCSNDDDAEDSAVNIRVENRGEVLITKLTIDNNTYLNIPPGVFTEYQVFVNGNNFPPSVFFIESEEQNRGYVLDYARGARIEDGFYTYVAGFDEDGGIFSSFEED